MFLTDDHQLGFIHIPRTGGTSVSESFALSPVNIKHVCRTHAHYNEYHGSAPAQWFATIRHPAARLHSGYYYQIEQDRKRLLGMLPLKSDLTLDFLQARIDLFESYGFEQTIISEKFKKHYQNLKQKHSIQSLNVLEQMQSICKYIQGCENIILFDIETQADKLFEWIKQYITFVNYTHNNSKLEKSNWKDQLSDKLIEYIKNNYKDDLARFDYQL